MSAALRRRVRLPDSDDPAAANGDRPPRGPRGIALAALLLGAVGAGWLVLSWLDRDDRPQRYTGASGAATATVARQTLVDRESVDGVLGYSDSRTVINRLGGSGGGGEGDGSATNEPDSGPDGRDRDPDSGSDDATAGSGTLTRLARAGSVVERGRPLYEIDGVPVLLMYGATPAYRTLRAGVEDGRDIEQLEQNLAALGFDPGIVDDYFSSTTSAAVRDWQESLGLDETGSVELGRVIFLPGPRRIGERTATVGQILSAGQEVLETTSTRRVVKVELDVALQSLVRKGAGVEVTLPGGRTVKGRIARIGRVAREQDAGGDSPDGGASSGEEELVIDLSVELRSRKEIGRLDQAPVSVGIARESARKALAVPVNALLARRGGGYAVELAGSGRIVRVETGLFASGLVEISGAGIRAGTRVRVPE